MKHIHKILANNYEILKKVIGDSEKIEIPESTLTTMGFHIDFHTQTVNDYRNVYTLSWLSLRNGNVMISRVPRQTYRGGYTIR